MLLRLSKTENILIVNEKINLSLPMLSTQNPIGSYRSWIMLYTWSTFLQLGIYQQEVPYTTLRACRKINQDHRARLSFFKSGSLRISVPYITQIVYQILFFVFTRGVLVEVEFIRSWMLSSDDFLSKSGIISLIQFKNVLFCKEYLLQSNKKCVSFST